MTNHKQSAETAKAILVTRPEPSATAFANVLQQQSFPVLIQPMLKIKPLAEARLKDAKKHILALDEFYALIFISINAVKHGMSLIDEYWPQFPLGVRCLAIGSCTAAALSEWGIKAQAGNQAMNSESLLALNALSPEHVDDKKILLVKGVAGRETLAEILTERGAKVELLECYQREPVMLDAIEFQQNLTEHHVSVLTATSGESLKNLQSLLAEEHLQWPLVVPGRRVAALAEEMGFSRVITAENAGVQAMLAAIKQVSEY